jgi:hypothetical protein
MKKVSRFGLECSAVNQTGQGGSPGLSARWRTGILDAYTVPMTRAQLLLSSIMVFLVAACSREPIDPAAESVSSPATGEGQGGFVSGQGGVGGSAGGAGGWGGHSWAMIEAGCEARVTSSRNANNRAGELPFTGYAIANATPSPGQSFGVMFGNSWGPYPTDYTFLRIVVRGPWPVPGLGYELGALDYEPHNFFAEPPRTNGLFLEESDGRFWAARPGARLRVREVGQHPAGLVVKWELDGLTMVPASTPGNTATGSFTLSGRCTSGISGY